MWSERIALERESGVRMLDERNIGVGNREVRARERERKDCVWMRKEDGDWEGGVREMGNWDKRVG